ncbi:hypothetical protein SAMN04488553_0381 [Gramella sp. MAR_2010_147]|nr:hypothetical protein SAMN04488553_0381 [Gramella sp. MAR_2010_147]
MNSIKLGLLNGKLKMVGTSIFNSMENLVNGYK